MDYLYLQMIADHMKLCDQETLELHLGQMKHLYQGRLLSHFNQALLASYLCGDQEHFLNQPAEIVSCEFCGFHCFREKIENLKEMRCEQCHEEMGHEEMGHEEITMRMIPPWINPDLDSWYELIEEPSWEGLDQVYHEVKVDPMLD